MGGLRVRVGIQEMDKETCEVVMLQHVQTLHPSM